MLKTRKVVSSGLVALLAAATLAACGDAPEEDTTGSGSDSTPAASDFLPCMVSDAGGFDDKSFNQLGYEGLEQAADELGVELKAVESNSETDYAPNIESLVDAGLQPHRDRRLRPRRRDQRSRPRPTPTSSSS